MASTNLRPMLAASIDSEEQLEGLAYPIHCSPKIDGIRCLIHPEIGPVTRSFKPIPNMWLREQLGWTEHNYFDGELVLGDWASGNVFNRTTSAVMTHDGEPRDVVYWVFDHWGNPERGYYARCENLQQQLHFRPHSVDCAVKIQRVEYCYIAETPQQILEAEQGYLELGFEGIMLRDMRQPYKFGRSTLRQGALIKMKRMQDDEATVTGFEPLRHNENPQTRDNFGLARRSSHADGKVQVETLGNLRVSHATFGEFSIGSGFDQAQRDEIWSNRETYLGQRISFKYQKVGIVNSPRFPIFKGFRPHE